MRRSDIDLPPTFLGILDFLVGRRRAEVPRESHQAWREERRWIDGEPFGPSEPRN